MTRYRTHPLTEGIPPPWAEGWGQDRFGVFVEIRFGEVVQRMRWIFSGTFQMGSPEEEAGRFDWEGPRHAVTLTQGFWLADTPCTQALWQEVMGENPSEFVSPQRPVERVSWEDCQQFVDRCDKWLPGVAFRLPTEAQWEYACRAGTDTATWRGDLVIEGERNAPRLDAIAWYGGNSGVDFDLEKGRNTSRWEEKQHPHTKAGTRVVKTKQPNPWGLYDMLGNVYEWCRDQSEWSRGYEGSARIDPLLEDGPGRVIRGGSWFERARSVRAAFRSAVRPGDRSPSLGFRLFRGPEPGGR